MLTGPVKTLLAASGITLALATTVLAQIPTPAPVASPAPVSKEAAPAPTAIPFSNAPIATPEQPQVPEEEIDLRVTPEGERRTQENRVRERAEEAANGGFKWMSWKEAGPKIWAFVDERNPKAKAVIGNGKRTDIAIADLDRDNQPDVIVHVWEGCGSDGCLNTIYYNNKVKPPQNFIVHSFKPYSEGVLLDGARYKL